MRNVFDQYSQPENRLTHALMSCLAEDAALCRDFVAWAAGFRPMAKRLEVMEQCLPGDSIELTEEEAERRGLPDGAITDNESFALIIESKVAAATSTDQLQRHLRTVDRRGVPNVVLLLISVGPPNGRLPRRVVARTWPEVYKWLTRKAQREARHSWARRCAEYLEIAEARGADENYLKEGTLTAFSGIPFGAESPYNYFQAKRLLGLLRNELCRDKRLARQIGADLNGQGRPAITGRDGSAVWPRRPPKFLQLWPLENPPPLS